ncbi:hypothetical protein A9Q96_01330 [Rhodobacterales bacterium 52_120_T64]|nr:hypothetical protein A9Q96_01330 [Rhodobacterales bacterium 52_120_T64]
MVTKGKTGNETTVVANPNSARLSDEAPHPVMRVGSNGETLYANAFCDTLDGWLDPKTRKLAKEITKKAVDCFKSDNEVSMEFVSGDKVFVNFITPVPGQNYVNVYGRDITQSRLSEKQLADLAKFPDENPNPILRVKLDGGILFANDAARNLTEIYGNSTLDFLNRELLQTVVDARQAGVIRQATLDTNGETYLFSVVPITNENYLNVYGREITAEREAQEELVSANDHLEQRIADRTASVKLLQNIVLSSNNAESFEVALQTALHEICTYTNWAAGHAYVVEENDGALRLNPTGIWHVETNSDVSDLRSATEGLRFSSPDGLPGRVLNRGQAAWSEDLSQDDRFRRSEFTKSAGLISGMAFPVVLDEKVIGVLEFFSATRADPDVELIKTLGHVGTLLGSVAERKRAERFLSESKEEAATSHARLIDALGVMGQSICLFDKDDRIVLFNKRYVELYRSWSGGLEPAIGISFEDILRQSSPVMLPDMPLDEQEARIQRILKKRATHKVRSSSDRMPDGKWMKSEGFDTSDGGTVSVFTNITESKEHEAELDTLVEELGAARDEAVKANSAKSQFLANMSHELRTPLNAIIGYSELLIDDAQDDENEEYVPDLEKISKAGKHLLGLINDILDLSKIEIGKIELFVEEIEVSSLLKDVADTIQPLIASNNNKLVIEQADDIGAIHSDMTKLRQNLFNLLSNAAKFSKDSNIKIRVCSAESSNGKQIEFHIEDQGIGMTETQLAKIFDPFTQADSSTSKEFGGTGLGLTITREFSRKMGGDIKVTSEIGKGTVFSMSILADCRYVDAEDYDFAEVEVSDDAPLILVIDDDRNVRDLLRRNLTTAGYRTALAPGGEEGLTMAEELLPDAITLDVIMPQTDGWKVLSRLKSNSTTAHIPVVMVSIVEDRPLGFSLGASEYLSKPVDRKQLAKVLKRFLGDNTNRTVLVVEDDADTRDAMSRYLKREGALPIEAENGLVGLEKLAKIKPALILLDLMMPEMDGFEFIEQYRENPAWHEIPVIVLTAKTLTDDDRNRLDGWVKELYSKDDSNIEHVLNEVCALLPSKG